MSTKNMEDEAIDAIIDDLIAVIESPIDSELDDIIGDIIYILIVCELGLKDDRVEQLCAGLVRQKVHELLAGRDSTFVELFRMSKSMFFELVSWLQQNTEIKDSQRLTIETKVLIFLYVICQGTTQRMAAHFFRCAQRTVGNIIQEALEAFSCLFEAFVTLPSQEFVSIETAKAKHCHHFHGCIGAIDGTHIKAFVPRADQKRYFDRHGLISQNVLAAVKLNGTFSYVLAGAEGSVNDASLIQVALQKSFQIPEKRFYVVDAGFGSEPGLLVPFVGVRYHLQEWKKGQEAPQNYKELYNLRQSRLRIIVEQVFGRVKRKFRILRSAVPEYSAEKQSLIVYATTGLWNFIQAKKGEVDGTGERDEEEIQKDVELFDKIKTFANENVDAANTREYREKVAMEQWQEYVGVVAARAAAGLLEDDASDAHSATSESEMDFAAFLDEYDDDEDEDDDNNDFWRD